MLAVVEHNTVFGHCILVNNTNMLDRKSKCKNQLIQEETEIKLHPNSLNQKMDSPCFLCRLGSLMSIAWKKEGSRQHYFTLTPTSIFIKFITHCHSPHTEKKSYCFAQIKHPLWNLTPMGSVQILYPPPPNYYYIQLNQNESP